MLKLKKQERKESYAIFRRSRVSSQFLLVVLRKSKEFDLVLRRQKGAEIQIHKRNTNVFLLESTWNIFKHKKSGKFQTEKYTIFLGEKTDKCSFFVIKTNCQKANKWRFSRLWKEKSVAKYPWKIESFVAKSVNNTLVYCILFLHCQLASF